MKRSPLLHATTYACVVGVLVFPALVDLDRVAAAAAEVTALCGALLGWFFIELDVAELMRRSRG